jgi:hypothetical protein
MLIIVVYNMLYIAQNFNFVTSTNNSNFLLKCLYQARKASDHVLVCKGYRLPLSMNLILDFRIVLTVWYCLVFHLNTGMMNNQLFFVSIGTIHHFSHLVTLLFHKWLHVRLNHKDACILTLT